MFVHSACHNIITTSGMAVDIRSSHSHDFLVNFFYGFGHRWHHAPHLMVFSVLVVAIVCQYVECSRVATCCAVAICLAYQCARMAYWKRVQILWHNTKAEVLLESWLWGFKPIVLVKDQAHISKLKREDVIKDDYAPYYFACANHSILGSAGETWRRDMKVVHPWIVSYVGPRILERVRSKRPSPPADGTDVCLFDWLSAHISSISAEAIGVPAWDVRRTWSKIVFLLWLTLMTGDKWRWLGRLIFRRSQHDRCLRARVKEAPEFQSLRNSFGVDVAVGHIYAVLLGSTLPETTIACDIMHELAGHHQLQEEVCRWAAHDERAFEAFIRDRCEEYTFFAVGKPRRMPLTGEICRIDHEIARTPWGIGLRACPGARIGLHTVSAVCRHVLEEYELGLCGTSQLESMPLAGHHILRGRAHIRLARRSGQLPRANFSVVRCPSLPPLSPPHPRRSVLSPPAVPWRHSGPMAPDWRPLVESYPEAHRLGIGRRIIDRAEQWAANATQFEAAGSWRAKVVNGSLWVKTIHMYSHWAERGSVLRLIVAALRQDGPPIPDAEFVYASADRDPTPRRLRRTPVFANAHQAGRHSLPLPEFTWAGVRETPPWCQLAQQLDAAASSAPFVSRSARAYFSGGLHTSKARRTLQRLAESRPEEFHVRNVGFRSTGSTFRQWTVDKYNRTGDLLHALPSMPPSHACRYKFLLSVPGYGYASRLRQLLACRSVVLHQADTGGEEFFAPLLRHDENVIRLPVGDTPSAVSEREATLLDTLRQLRTDESRAARIASAAGEFARVWLSHASVLAYTRTLLTEYGKLYSDKVQVEPGYVRVETGEDIQSVTKLCACSAALETKRCLRQGQPGVPGSGAGVLSWRMGKARPCPHTSGPFQLHALRNARCCPVEPHRKTWAERGGGSPYGGVAHCWQPQCCKQWDCPTTPLDCPG